MLKLTTKELIAFLKKHKLPDTIRPIECNIRGRWFNCTHLISYVDEETIIDCGIDETKVELPISQFLKEYPRTVWTIHDYTLQELANGN